MNKKYVLIDYENIQPSDMQALERHLRHEPTKTSKSRIKRLRGLSKPQYRLRVGEIRIFYRKKRIKKPNLRVRAAIQVIVENQVALGTEIPAQKTLERLKRKADRMT